MLTIRYSKEEDAELIATISRKTFFETFAANNTKEDMELFMSEQFSQEKLIQEAMEPQNTFLLAFDDLSCVGYAMMREGFKYPDFENQESIEIARLYVVNPQIGSGMGKALMQKCILHSKELKKQVIWLGVWEKNIRAISFYKKWGFEKFGEHDFILGEDVQRDWLMKKQI
jgi:diamine N-acetyltransferase